MIIIRVSNFGLMSKMKSCVTLKKKIFLNQFGKEFHDYFWIVLDWMTNVRVSSASHSLIRRPNIRKIQAMEFATVEWKINCLDNRRNYVFK